MEAMNRQMHRLLIGCVPFSDFHLWAPKSRWTIGCGTFLVAGSGAICQWPGLSPRPKASLTLSAGSDWQPFSDCEMVADPQKEAQHINKPTKTALKEWNKSMDHIKRRRGFVCAAIFPPPASLVHRRAATLLVDSYLRSDRMVPFHFLPFRSAYLPSNRKRKQNRIGCGEGR